MALPATPFPTISTGIAFSAGLNDREAADAFARSRTTTGLTPSFAIVQSGGYSLPGPASSTPINFVQPITPGNLLIVVINNVGNSVGNPTPGTWANAASSGTGGGICLMTYRVATAADVANGGVYSVITTSGGGNTSGATVVWMEVSCTTGWGQLDQGAQGPLQTGTHSTTPCGPTATLSQAIEFAVAAVIFTDSSTYTASWSNSFASLINQGPVSNSPQISVATLVTASTAGPSTTDTHTSSFFDTVGLIASFEQFTPVPSLNQADSGQWWEALAGQWATDGSGHAVLNTVSPWAAYNLAVVGTGPNMTDTVTLPTVADQAGLCFRVQDPANFWRFRANGATNYLLEQVLAGTATTIATVAVTPTNGDVLAAYHDGGTITVTVNGAHAQTVVTGLNVLTAADADFESGIGGWGFPTNCTIAQTVAQAHTGTHSLVYHCTGAGNAFAQTGLYPVVPGQTWYGSAYMRAATTGRQCGVFLNWLTATGAFISNVLGTLVADTTTGWTFVTVSGTAPPGAAFAYLAPEVVSPGVEDHYVDTVMLSQNNATVWSPGGTDGGLSSAWRSGLYAGVANAATFANFTSAFNWTDVSQYVLFDEGPPKVTRGKQHETDAIRAGTANYRLWNIDRRFDPSNIASPYYPNVVPMRRVRTQLGWTPRNLVVDSEFNTMLYGPTGAPPGDPVPPVAQPAWLLVGIQPGFGGIVGRAIGFGPGVPTNSFVRANVIAACLDSTGYTCSAYVDASQATSGSIIVQALRADTFAVIASVTVAAGTPAGAVQFSFTQPATGSNVGTYFACNSSTIVIPAGAVVTCSRPQIELGAAFTHYCPSGFTLAPGSTVPIIPTTWPLFYGYVERWPLSFVNTEFLSVMDIVASDDIANYARSTVNVVPATALRHGPKAYFRCGDVNLAVPQDYTGRGAQLAWITSLPSVTSPGLLTSEPSAAYATMSNLQTGGNGGAIITPANQIMGGGQQSFSVAMWVNTNSVIAFLAASGGTPLTASATGKINGTQTIGAATINYTSVGGGFTAAGDITFGGLSGTTTTAFSYTGNTGTQFTGVTWPSGLSGSVGDQVPFWQGRFFGIGVAAPAIFYDDAWPVNLGSGIPANTPAFVMFVRDSDNGAWLLYVNGVLSGRVAFGANNIHGGRTTPTNFPTVATMGLGDVIIGVNNYGDKLQDVMLFDYALTAAQAANLYNQVVGSAQCFSQAGQLLDCQRIPNNRRILSTSPAEVTMPAAQVDNTQFATALFTNIGNSDAGILFVDGAGYTRWRNRDNLLGQLRPSFPFGNDAVNGFPGEGLTVSDDIDRLFTAVNLSIGGTTYVAVDAQAEAQTGQQTLQLTAPGASPANSPAWLLGRYSRHVQRIDQITLRPWELGGHWEAVLGYEVGDRIFVSLSPGPVGSLQSPPMLFDVRITSITHDNIGWADWTVTWRLEAIGPTTNGGPGWVADDPLYGAADTTTTGWF